MSCDGWFCYKDIQRAVGWTGLEHISPLFCFSMVGLDSFGYVLFFLLFLGMISLLDFSSRYLVVFFCYVTGVRVVFFFVGFTAVYYLIFCFGLEWCYLC
ncbi:hypothetical protein V8F06_001156 [Rhypophila decipiens]